VAQEAQPESHSERTPSRAGSKASPPVVSNGNESLPDTLCASRSIESAAAPESSAAPGPECITTVDVMKAQLEELVSLVKERLAYDQTKEQAFERLYTELDTLKRNAALEQTKPLLLDLILLYDRMEHARHEAAAVQGTVSTEMLESFIHELLEVLYRREVSLVEASPSSFDCNQQKAIGVVDVADPAQHQRIHKVVRRGFRLAERTLRPEEVIVCRVLAPPPTVKPDTNEGHKT
jgi:molecular chaperone GrpE